MLPAPCLIDTIIPAWNEADRIAAVIAALRGAPQHIGRIIVVDDGSRDATADAARAAGAHEVITQRNAGKAQAMKTGFAVSTTDPVLFLDGDLIGLKPTDVAYLVESARGFDVCGAVCERDEPLQNLLAVSWAPFITGQRVVRRWVVGGVPTSCWRAGYAIETALNWACREGGGRLRKIIFYGVSHVEKTQKDGNYLLGAVRNTAMIAHIIESRRRLNQYGCCT